MRNNLPVTQKQIDIAEGSILSTTTDLNGNILTATTDFIEVSGFTREEMIGQPHNMIRHPDVPAAVFQDLWTTLEKGKSWNAMVKNRASSGDHYWVEANVSPIVENGQTVGYVSVRTAATAEQIKAAEQLYKDVASGKMILAEGIAKTPTQITLENLNVFNKIKVKNRIYLMLWAQLLIGAGLVANAFMALGSESVAGALVAALIVICIVFFTVLSKVFASIEQMKVVMQTTEQAGMFNQRVKMADNGDELSEMAKAFNVLMGNIQRSITSVNDVMASMGRGQFDLRVTDQVSGDLKIMKDGVNLSADQVTASMNELKTTLIAMSEGDFNHTVDMNYQGEYFEMMKNADQSIRFMRSAIDGIIQVMRKMQEGQFDTRVNVEARGDLQILKEGVNVSIDAMDRAIKEITHVMVAQSKGDLTQRIQNEYSGDLGVLTQAINTSSIKLADTVSEILDLSSIVSTSSRQVSEGSNELSQRTQEQAAMIEETAASMEEMTSTVEHNTAAAQQANQLSMQARQAADTGAKIADQAVEAMQHITESSQQIADIIALIDGIAFQTNLLALNAAVEAARAGDHGRGFAVVAGEVRTLAQRSADASNDIKRLIENSVASVEEGSKFVSQTGASLNDINQSIQKVNDIVAEIASASKEQATGINQVNVSVASMDETTQQNGAFVEETTAAAGSLSDQAENMRNLMSFFKTHCTS